jgi:alkanesulfonate monooxygenase SsuD/methylene tetrahydromethanopterin reductase-like flavin-dependent oxidoreductase (luciferase family)
VPVAGATYGVVVKHGIFIAPFGRFADPHKLVDLAATAEESGWDGVFLWDHVLRNETNEIIDAWVALGAMAAATTRIRLGPMVTPVPRRRPIKLAREILTVDLMSDGRLTVGVGSGTDSGGELSRFDEIVDARARGARLDEGLDIITALLEGETLAHVGAHFRVDGVSLEPRPAQQPRPPIWVAARGRAMKPVRRAARMEGIFPIEVDDDSFARMLDEIVAVRGDLDGFDVCLRTEYDGTIPAFASRGATWMLRGFPPVVEHEKVFDAVVHGPPR